MGFEHRNRVGAAFCCALIAVPLTAVAKDGRDGDRPRGRDRDRIERAYEGREAGRLKPVSELIGIVIAAYGGRVVEIEFEDDEGIYEFYLLGKDGRIREIEVDGRSGAILSAEVDD